MQIYGYILLRIPIRTAKADSMLPVNHVLLYNLSDLQQFRNVCLYGVEYAFSVHVAIFVGKEIAHPKDRIPWNGFVGIKELPATEIPDLYKAFCNVLQAHSASPENNHSRGA